MKGAAYQLSAKISNRNMAIKRGQARNISCYRGLLSGQIRLTDY